MELKAGAAVYAPWSTSRSVVDSNGNRQWQFFHAFADGYQGWLPAGATYEGNGNFRNPGRGDRSYGHLSQSPQNPTDDCHRFANIVEQIANDAANADEFLQRMVDRFIGPNLHGSSGADFERAANIGNREFGASGFKQQFVDTSNQVRHFTGGLWAGYLYGPGFGQLGMNSNEDNTITSGRGILPSLGGILPTFWPTEDSKADVTLNSVSVPLGITLTPRKEEIVDRGDRGGWRIISGRPGYKGLAKAIREQVCQ